MRTTLNLDDDLLRAARSLARARSASLSEAVSELLRRGLEQSHTFGDEDGFPVFRVLPSSRPITLEDVKQIEDEP